MVSIAPKLLAGARSGDRNPQTGAPAAGTAWTEKSVNLLAFGGGTKRTTRADAVITGAGSGIGRAFATELIARGGRVVCADIDEAGARETATLLGDRALAVRCDVGSIDDVIALADTAEEWFGKPTDLMINNAGIGTGGTVVGETPLADWHKTVDVNLWGPIHGCHVFAPRLRAHGRGGIINMASAASFAAAPRMSAYNVTKAGVLALSETVSSEMAGTGIAVTVVCPTVVKTNIFDSDTISEDASGLISTLVKWTGVEADSIVRETLNAHDRGQLYVVPQLDAKVIWQLKRLAPSAYTHLLGLVERIAR